MVPKDEMKESVRLLHKMGFNLFGSYNTADYFNEVFKDQNIVVEHVEWAYENIGEDQEVFDVYVLGSTIFENLKLFNNRFLRERGMVFNPKMEYQNFLCIFQKNSAMAALGLKEIGKFLWESREKVCPVGCLSLAKFV